MRVRNMKYMKIINKKRKKKKRKKNLKKMFLHLQKMKIIKFLVNIMKVKNQIKDIIGDIVILRTSQIIMIQEIISIITKLIQNIEKRSEIIYNYSISLIVYNFNFI